MIENLQGKYQGFSQRRDFMAAQDEESMVKLGVDGLFQ
jgi:hypothetical protein